jgi:hypothetical protein
MSARQLRTLRVAAEAEFSPGSNESHSIQYRILRIASKSHYLRTDNNVRALRYFHATAHLPGLMLLLARVDATGQAKPSLKPASRRIYPLATEASKRLQRIRLGCDRRIIIRECCRQITRLNERSVASRPVLSRDRTTGPVLSEPSCRKHWRKSLLFKSA